MKRGLAAGFATIGLALGPALAQPADVVGRWDCRHSNQTSPDYPGPDSRYAFSLSLFPDGVFRAQGEHTNVFEGTSLPFRAEGRWHEGGPGFVVQGYQRRGGAPPQPFTLVFSSFAPGAMSHRAQTGYGPVSTYCRRSG